MAMSDADKEMAKRTMRQYCSSWEEVRYDEMHNKPYFVGKREKNSHSEILHPISCYKNLLFKDLKSCIVDSGSTSVNLAVYNSDSTVVLYKAELGLKAPVFLKERNIRTGIENSNELSNEPTSTKKRKFDTALGIPMSDHSENESTTDGFQIDLNLCQDSELSTSNLKNNEGSKTFPEDKSDIACS